MMLAVRITPNVEDVARDGTDAPGLTEVDDLKMLFHSRWISATHNLLPL